MIYGSVSQGEWTVVDWLWWVALYPAVFLGGIANKYGRTPGTVRINGVVPKFYWEWELPEDYDCDDLENKRSWLKEYRKRGDKTEVISMIEKMATRREF